MANYIDGFVLPIPRKHVDEYRKVAAAIADIVIEHGALSYQEYLGDDMYWEGTKSFPSTVKANENEVVLFGWIAFESREARDRVNKLTAADPRVQKLVAPLTDQTNLIFDASRMVFGGFKPFIRAEKG